MRVLVFGITDNPGGVETVIMNYYKEIIKFNIQFDFLCNTEIVAYEEEIKSMGGKVYRITSRSSNIKKYKKELKKFFEQNSNKYEAIWVNVCSLANIDYLKSAKKAGIKKRIIHSHNSQNMDSFLRGLLHRFNKVFISRVATDFWACSEESAKWFYSNKIIHSNDYRLIRNAISIQKFHYDKKIDQDYRVRLNLENKFIVGHVGRFHFQKNQKFIVEVFEEIVKLNSEAVLVFVGAGEDEEEVKKLVKDKNLAESVLFLGLRDDISNLLSMFNVLLFPSLFEGLPLTLIEAQAAALPIVTSSEAIEKYVNMTGLISFLSLDDSKYHWAQIVLKQSIDRTTYDISGIFSSGYDIITETAKFKRFIEK